MKRSLLAKVMMIEHLLDGKTSKNKKRRGKKAKATVQRQSTKPPRPKGSPSSVEIAAPTSEGLAQLQIDVREIKPTISSISRCLVKLKRTILSMDWYNPLCSTQINRFKPD